MHKQESFYKKAKREGFRARSAYKLLDIQNRFNIFKRAFYILDLGCAPGSWLQVAKNFAEENLTKYKDQFYHRDHYKIMGVDIKKVSPIKDIHIIRADFTKIEIQMQIDSYFDSKLDLILSDASIKKIGNKFTDHMNQIRLCNEILKLVELNLKNQGNLVIKAFQGSDFESFTKKMKQIFKFLKSYKPKSSKKKSNEIYLVGLSKL